MNLKKVLLNKIFFKMICFYMCFNMKFYGFFYEFVLCGLEVLRELCFEWGFWILVFEFEIN